MTDYNHLLSRIKERDEVAFDQLYDATHEGVFAFLFAIVNDRMTAEDLTQDTYMKMLTHIDTFDRRSGFKTWLLAIAKHLAFDHLRRAGKTLAVDPVDGEYLFPVHNDRVEEKLMARELLSRLNSEERAIVLLKTIDNMTHRQIGQVLKKPAGTVMWLYNRAIKKMREDGKEDGHETP